MIDPIDEAMNYGNHPEYDALPEAIKLVHSPLQFLWLGEERLRVIERETQPDMDVTE